MPDLNLNPTRLSVFSLDRLTGAPVPRLPVYAEVAWTKREQPPPPDGRFDDLIRRALSLADAICEGSEACRAKVLPALGAALTAVWPQGLRDQLSQDVDRAIDLLTEVVDLAREAEGVASLDDLPADRAQAALERALREVSERRELPVEPRREPATMRATYPLGVLATDHVGYLSFDLKPLPAPVLESVVRAIRALRDDPNSVAEAAVWVYPFSAEFERYDALPQRRYAHGAIVMRLEFHPPDIPRAFANFGLLAMQNPGLTDWRLSPASFAANPGALVGQDGCESLLPANVALQEFHFYQVVSLTDVSPAPELPPNERRIIKLGVVHDYRQLWYPLGHSLGQILYSLPLAPGESVNLAVIDWTRRDLVRRDETTKLNEQIVHHQRRDRTITETVNAALKEYQEGSSFMAGLAHSVGASASLEAVGLAAGSAKSIGGASSESTGSRELAASTVQKLTDNISQASSAMRELQSTVVVQGTQAEREAIETRTVVNYNHSHALTVLYYEVLRHFRIVTDLAAVRPVVLVEGDTVAFGQDDRVIEHQFLLEQALLDERLRPCFEAVNKLICLRAAAKAQAKLSPRNWSFTMFTVELLTGKYPEGGSSLRFSLVLKDGRVVRLLRANVASPDPTEHKGDPYTGPGGEYAKTVLIPEGGQVSFAQIKVLRVNFVGHDKLLQDRGFADPRRLGTRRAAPRRHALQGRAPPFRQLAEPVPGVSARRPATERCSGRRGH